MENILLVDNNNNSKEEVFKATLVESASKAGFYDRVQELIRQGSLDFATWTSLISKIEKLCPDNLEVICSVYDSFLLEFPLCHEYWKSYIAHKTRLCNIDEVVEVYERAVRSASYCVSIWVEYCSFCVLAYENPSDIRSLFKRAISFVGRDYMCHTLWDKYLEFESSQQEWSLVAQIYVEALKVPTKKLQQYYDNFKKFVDILKEEMKQHIDSEDIEMESVPDTVITPKDEMTSLIDNQLHPFTSYFRKFISIGERYYCNASELEKKIYCFENNIRRTNFEATSVDDDELENWRQYLNFVENQGDFDWAVKLYERCLIPCSGYPLFWMRYVEFTETKGGRELAKFALNRATKIFLKNSPAIHLFNVQYKEFIGDKTAAHNTLVWSASESNLDFAEKIVRESNREKRLGNFEAACAVYDKALEIAAENKKLHTVSILYIHFARLIYVMTGKRDQARDVIIKGLKHLPYCKILIEGLINFLTTHGDIEETDLVDSIVADAISDGSQSLSDEDRQDISLLYFQFVDLCGNIHDINKVWSRHIKSFPNSIKPSFLDKHHNIDNQLVEIEEQILSPEKLALQIDEYINIRDHAQREDDNDITKEKSSELSPESTRVDQITHDSVHKSTQDLVGEKADDAEKGQKSLSLAGISLDDQEMECRDFVSSVNCSNVSSSPLIVRQGSSPKDVPNQTQNDCLNKQSLDRHGSATPDQPEMDTHKTQGNPIATHSELQDVYQQNTVPIIQQQPNVMRAFHTQPQMPPYQMQGVDDVGYNQPYNNMAGYYYQQQQYIQQQYYMQQQQYMQQIQQQPNMPQPHDQHMFYVQQQQQLAQMYYQHPQLYQQLYQGQQVMTQYDPTSSGIAETSHPPKQPE